MHLHSLILYNETKIAKSYIVLSPKKEKVQATVSYFVAYCRFKMVADIKVKVSLMLLFLSIFMWFFFMVSVRATKYRLKSKFFLKKSCKKYLANISKLLHIYTGYILCTIPLYSS